VLFRENVFRDCLYRLANYVERELGVRIQGGGMHWYEWDKFIQIVDLPDLLDTVTIVFDFMKQYGASEYWLKSVQRIFVEENLDYVVDNAGVVHPFVDQEFQGNRASVIAGLEGSRYGNVRDAFERASRELRGDNPKEAWRAIFGSVEALFKLMFPAASRLTAREIQDRLVPIIQQRYAGDATALRAATRLANSLKEWVDASHNYRHEQEQEEPLQPPLDSAVFAISMGTSVLRWLAEMDRDQEQG
jgi:hypothetical protein